MAWLVWTLKFVITTYFYIPYGIIILYRSLGVLIATADANIIPVNAIPIQPKALAAPVSPLPAK